MGKPAELTPTTFLTLLRESGLVAPDQLQSALVDAPTGERAKALARFLIKRGLLTRFQAQQLLAGRTGGFFLGQYRILDMLGRGGMGKVYKAEHMTMARLVALKVLNSDVTRTERARELFRREVRAAARLVHPNIATAFDANEVNGRAFLVLEYVAGPSLSHLVKSGAPLPIGQACELIRQAAVGLQHAHERGMVHRDIKPSNLLIGYQQFPISTKPESDWSTADGNLPVVLKIVDFGLALLPTALGNDDTLEPDRHVVLGTPDYLSPEQATDIRSVDIRSDLYSLGCTFYYLLTGQPPFPGGTAMEKLHRHASEEPVPIEFHRPSVPPGVAAAVRKLLAKRPQDRFQTPFDLADTLAEFAEVRPVNWIDDRRTTGDDLVVPEEGEPEVGSSAGGAMSGTLSLAEIASTLDAAQRAGSDPVIRPARWHSTLLFMAAIAAGFLTGAILIVSALLKR
ncbi:MAG: serine/threonine protein kinase [Gemmataceae bacterium]